MGNDEGIALDYSWILISSIIIAPIIINVALGSFLHFTDPWLTIASFICNFVAMFLIKQYLKERYGEVFNNPLLFGIALVIVSITLFCLYGTFGITIFTVIGTIAGMILSFIGINNIIEWFRDR